MEKKMETTVMGYVGTTAPNWLKKGANITLLPHSPMRIGQQVMRSASDEALGGASSLT